MVAHSSEYGYRQLVWSSSWAALKCSTWLPPPPHSSCIWHFFTWLFSVHGIVLYGLFMRLLFLQRSFGTLQEHKSGSCWTFLRLKPRADPVVCELKWVSGQPRFTVGWDTTDFKWQGCDSSPVSECELELSSSWLPLLHSSLYWLSRCDRFMKLCVLTLWSSLYFLFTVYFLSLIMSCFIHCKAHHPPVFCILCLLIHTLIFFLHTFLCTKWMVGHSL